MNARSAWPCAPRSEVGRGKRADGWNKVECVCVCVCVCDCVCVCVCNWVLNVPVPVSKYTRQQLAQDTADIKRHDTLQTIHEETTI